MTGEQMLRRRNEALSGLSKKETESFLKNENMVSKIPSPKKIPRPEKPIKYELTGDVSRSRIYEEKPRLN